MSTTASEIWALIQQNQKTVSQPLSSGLTGKQAHAWAGSQWADDWSKPAKPKFYFKGIGFRHFAVFNEDGVPIHHLRFPRKIARGKFEAYVRKLEAVNDLIIK